MSTQPRPAFTAIEPPALASVSGGRRSASSTSASDDRLMDSLNSLENTVRDLGRNRADQPDAMSQMMPILAMSMMQQPAAAPAPPQVLCAGRRRRC